jgi:hypothetical protein
MLITGSDSNPPGEAALAADPSSGGSTEPASIPLPYLWFEPSLDDADELIAFQVNGLGYSAHLTREGGARVSLRGKQMLQLELQGSSRHPQATGLDRLPSVSNYLLGSDRRSWRTGVPHFGRVCYVGVYPGVDLSYHGDGGYLEYDFHVAPDADPGQIRLTFRGAERTSISEGGDLVVSTTAGDLIQRAPMVYQEIGGERRRIDGSFKLLSQERAEPVVGFEIGDYDPSLPLVIDPKIDYSTYLGGTADDLAYAMAVDSSGYVYVTGYTHSTNFPTQAAIDGARAASADVFVTKLDPSGPSLVYSTYLGGSVSDVGNGIAVDSSGNVYVAGETTSTNFPTHNAYQPSIAGGGGGGIIPDGFIAKLNASGSAFIFSTYWGGTGEDRIKGLALDILGNP